MDIKRSGRWIAPAIAGLILTSAVACTDDGATGRLSAKSAEATATITPANGSSKVRTDKGVTVTADNGVLENVSVQSGGDSVDGEMSTDKKSWRTRWPLKPGTAYNVSVRAKNAVGKATTATSAFTTMKASSTIKVTDVIPAAGETVGVGMPITVTFDRPVAKRAAIERALEVRSTAPMEGGWRWITDQQVIFRPKTYWPAHTQVSLVSHLSGAGAGTGVYRAKEIKRDFSVGASHIARVNLKTHKSKVYIDGRLAKTILVSGGMGGYDGHGNDFRTTSGVHLAMGKMPEVWMTSPNIKEGEAGYYHELVLNDVQISNSGEFLHKSPGEYECLGKRNCSHGCVRQSPAGAAWFFKITKRGDVITITGTSRKLEWNNGWGYWQLSFDKWLKGGALKQPVTTTPMPATPPGGATAPGAATPAPGHG